MESHPIPQQISSYQFRLVGDMTLKQFFQLAGGALIALLIYSTGLHPIIKWPLIFLSVGVAAALAFLPFEERPLSKWMISFFRSVYTPSVFVWKKEDKIPAFFLPEEATTEKQNVVASNSKSPPGTPQAKLEKEEESFLSRITDLFSQLGENLIPNKADSSSDASPLTQQTIVENTPKTIEIPAAVPMSFNTQAKTNRPKIVVEENQGKTGIVMPEASTIISPTLTPSTFAPSTQAQFSESAAPPNPPSIPNTISGQVLDNEGKIIEGAILEIRDSAGRPVRALRSNKLGHFIIVTALPNGNYDVIADKEGFTFNPVSFEAKGDMIPPIMIKAVSKLAGFNVAYTGKPLVIN